MRSLADHRVEYLLIGGYAVGHYGYTRMTGDIDVWVRMESGNAARTVAALKDFGFDVPELQPDLFLEKDQIIRMGYPPQRIELMTSISGVTFEECWPKRVEADYDGIAVNVISLNCLRANKRASGRSKDLADLENLPE